MGMVGGNPVGWVDPFGLAPNFIQKCIIELMLLWCGDNNPITVVPKPIPPPTTREETSSIPPREETSCPA